jgi:hypothetical protein
MPTPKEGYRLADGTRVPGVTTVIGRFKDSGALMQWAFKQGKEGKRSLYEEAEKAADIGTCAHGLVELHIGNADAFSLDRYAKDALPDEDMRKKAWTAFNSYLKWAENFKVRVVEQECLLVSEKHRFGGTPDAIGVVGNELCLLDWKTSNAVYSDYLIQLAAYRHLWEENRPGQPITGGFHLLRFAKEHGDFSHHYFPDLSNAWRMFLLYREAYEIDKELKKRAA